VKLSVVIPTLNAAVFLPACLERMRGAHEIVIADGRSGDGTQRIAEAAGARIVSAPKGRGVQLRAGANAAKGDWLLFLHADTLPERDWRAAVQAHVSSYPGKAGCFRFRLDDDAWQARVVERGVALRSGLLGLPYGDQGLLVSRALYECAGGYRAVPLMEDVDLVRRIGRGRLRLLEAEAVTGADRWRRDGWARRSARNLLCLAAWRLGMSEARVAQFYEWRG
jgi:rSAM/selenodomain-associated transferase 2